MTHAEKLLSLEEAAALVRPRDSLGVMLGPGQPTGFLHALGERDDFEELVVTTALLVDLYPLFTKKGVHLRSGFFGPAERILKDAGNDVQFVPADFRRFGPIARQLNPRILATVATPPDADGNMSLSLHAGGTIEELRRCGADPDRLLLVEVNASFPRTLGLPPEHTHALTIDDADVVVESDRAPVNLPDPPVTEVDERIAAHTAEFIHDGCTLQTGIGAIPTVVAKVLADGPGGDYGVHSEMFTTGLLYLHRAGKVTNAHKGLHEGLSITTFALGTGGLYEWLEGNDIVRFLPVQYVNSPDVIAANRNMVTMNGALSIDLAGQICADAIGRRQHSGVGGHEDFIAGAGLELEDRSLICLPSTVTKSVPAEEGEVASRIVPEFGPGTLVTTPRHQVDVIVTEWGSAQVQGLTMRERAAAIAQIAHPDFRDELLAQAAAMWD